MYNAKLRHYQKDATKARLAGADPYEIIQMLMTGTLDNLNLAKSAIERQAFEQKSAHISKASAIINSLASCLDHDAGGEVSQNLEALYLYMAERLMDASLEQDAAIIDEVMDLMKEIKAGWDSIPSDTRQQVFAQKAANNSISANG